MTKMLLPVQMVFAVLCASAQVTVQVYLMPPADSDLHVYALPVGQGDATVIQCPSTYGGGVTIVDMGSSVRRQSCAGITYMTNSNILAFLGESQINYVYLTHADKDHYSIIPYLNIPVDNTLKGVFIGCDQSDYKGIISNWLQQVKSAGKLTTFAICTTGCASSVPICGGGDIRMKVMGANLDMYSPKECSNGDSLVLQLQHNNFKLLLPGDVEDYRGFKYNDEGFITSCVTTGDLLDHDTYLEPGVLRTLVNSWGPGLQSQFYRLAHHGSYPYANKPFFLEAIQPEYVFSSSMLPGTDGTYNHPNCNLYDEMKNNSNVPIATVSGGQQQKEYSCGLEEDRYLEDDNQLGIYTTVVADNYNHVYHYIIKIDTDGINFPVLPILIGEQNLHSGYSVSGGAECTDF